jgi:hypothetical protein
MTLTCASCGILIKYETDVKVPKKPVKCSKCGGQNGK